MKRIQTSVLKDGKHILDLSFDYYQTFVRFKPQEWN